MRYVIWGLVVLAIIVGVNMFGNYRTDTYNQVASCVQSEIEKNHFTGTQQEAWSLFANTCTHDNTN